MDLSLEQNVEAINDILNFIDVLSFIDLEILDPMADFDENS